MKKLLVLILSTLSVIAQPRYANPNFDTNSKVLYPLDLVIPRYVSTNNGTFWAIATGTDTARKVQDRFGEIINVKDLGVVGDGTTDDRANIQRALNLAMSGTAKTVYFPPGTYILSVPSNVTEVLSITNSIRIIGSGMNNTRLKIADSSAGKFHGIIYCSYTGTFDGIDIRDLTIDGNATSNFAAHSGDIMTAPGNYRDAIWLQGASNERTTIKNVRFTDHFNLNTVFASAATNQPIVSQIWIEGCVFDNIGRLDTTYNDHSTVYLNANKVWVLNNIFTGRSTNVSGITCAIELHSEDGLVFGNTIDTYERGMWVTGARSIGRTSKNLRIVDNNLKNVKVGIDIMAINVSDTSDNSTLQNGTHIAGNQITINRDAFPYATNLFFTDKSYGISVWHGNTAGIKNLQIDNNTIRFDTFTSSLSTGWRPFSAGIVLGNSLQTTNQIYSNFKITRNTIENAPANGIYSSIMVDNMSMDDNYILNCGQDTGLGSGSIYRAGIYLENGFANYSTMNDNKIIDNQNVATMQSVGIRLATTNSLESECVDNLVRSSTANFTPISTTSTADWFIRARYRSGGSVPTMRGRYGSVLIQENQGKVFVQRTIPTGTNWNRFDAGMDQLSNADVTLSIASAQVQMLATALTANRTITLPTNSISAGHRFKVFRLASSGGAYTLNVSTLKSLKAGESCEVIWDGGSWRLVESTFASLTELQTLIGEDLATQAELDAQTHDASDISSALPDAAAYFNPLGVLTASTTISATELGYLDNLTGNIQAQLDALGGSVTSGVGVTNIANVISHGIEAGANITLSTNGAKLVITSSASGGSGDDVYVNGSDIVNPNIQTSSTALIVAVSTNLTVNPTNIANAQIASGAAIDASKIGGGGVSTTEFNYLGTVTSDVQTQINSKQAAFTTGVGVTNISNVLSHGLEAGANMALTTNGAKLTITTLAETNAAANLGSGYGVYGSKTGVVLGLNSITNGIGVTVSSNSNTLTVRHNIEAGSNITLTTNGGALVITGAASGGAALTVQEEDGTPSDTAVTVIRVTNGKLTDNGSGDVSIDLTAATENSWYLPFSAARLTGCVLDTTETNDRILFDDSATETAVWQLPVPDDYATGMTLVFIIHYSTVSATSGNIEWAVDVMFKTRASGADVNVESYDTENTVTNPAPTTSGDTEAVAITLLNKDSIVAGSGLLKVRLKRKGGSGSDTATGDAELLYARLQWY